MKYIFLLLFVCVANRSVCQNNFVATDLFKGKVLLPLSTQLKQQECNGCTKPNYIFADKTNTVLLTATLTADTLSDNLVPGYADGLLKDLKASAGYTYIDDGISLNDWKNVGYIKYSRTTGEDKGFNCIFYGSLNNYIVLFAFNCPIKNRKLWEPTIDEIVAGLRIKD